MNMTKAWYIRSGAKGEIKGPFPGGQISQEILLGRYQINDEVSHDKEKWLVIRDVPELVPEILAENHDEPGFKNRLASARRWADERRGVASIDVAGERRTSESYESEEIKRLHRLATETKKKPSSLATFSQFAIVFILVASIIVLAFQYSPKNTTDVDCSAAVKQGIDLSGCDLSGIQLVRAKLTAVNFMNANLQTANFHFADLSHANLQYAQLHLTNLKYADFTKANLKGANLIGADLSGAIFSQANLSYANLRDANISDTNFSNATLDHAIWIDGRVCGVGSVGLCN